MPDAHFIFFVKDKRLFDVTCILKQLIEAFMKDEFLCEPVVEITIFTFLKRSFVSKFNDANSSTFGIKSKEVDFAV